MKTIRRFYCVHRWNASPSLVHLLLFNYVLWTVARHMQKWNSCMLASTTTHRPDGKISAFRHERESILIAKHSWSARCVCVRVYLCLSPLQEDRLQRHAICEKQLVANGFQACERSIRADYLAFRVHFVHYTLECGHSLLSTGNCFFFFVFRRMFFCGRITPHPIVAIEMKIRGKKLRKTRKRQKNEIRWNSIDSNVVATIRMTKSNHKLPFAFEQISN